MSKKTKRIVLVPGERLKGKCPFRQNCKREVDKSWVRYVCVQGIHRGICLEYLMFTGHSREEAEKIHEVAWQIIYPKEPLKKPRQWLAGY